MTVLALASRRPLLALACALVALAAAAPAAQAADLLLLDSEQATISGTQSYGFVYVDGELRLAGDTTILAGSIYFGPNAELRTCYVEGSGNNGCSTGRSLTLSASGPVTVSPGIDLRAGTGAVRNGGALNVSGAQVAIGGDVDTTGSGTGSSGAVGISSRGSLSVGAIYAHGVPVTLDAGGSIDVGGDVQAHGTSAIAMTDGGRVQHGAPVRISSSAGDVRVSGNVTSYGRDAPGGGLGGGHGGEISIAGGDVRVGTLDGTGGTSVDSWAGSSAPIGASARGSLHVLGRIEASGQGSNNHTATAGARVSASAGGPLVVAGGVWAGGGQGSTGGMPGGSISLKGGTVATGTLWAPGANAPNSGTPGDAGAGGSISVAADAGVTLGQLQANGGNAPPLRLAGRGGSVSVASAGGSIATGRISTQGGWAPDGPGAAGGPVALSAAGDLTAGDSINTSGSSANGAADPARDGGSAGAIVLRAAGGTLTLGDSVRAEGGWGASHSVDGSLGGRGGDGGRIDVIARAIGSIVAISAHGGAGGDWGDDRGPGGSGGAVHAWTDAPLFDDQKVVDTDGGDGNPVGASGAKATQQSPLAPAVDAGSGLLSFTPRSPGAQGYRILRSIAGGPPEVVLTTGASAGIKPPAGPLCQAVVLTVVAFNDAVGWASPPSPPVSHTRQPSSTQQCGDAPALTTGGRLRFSRRALRRHKWEAAVPLRSSGVGSLQGTLHKARRRGVRGSGRALTRVKATLMKAGAQRLLVRLPRAARRAGRYTLRLTTTAPDGTARRTTTLKLEVK